VRVTGGGGPARASEQPGSWAARARCTLDVVGTRLGINTAHAELVTQGEIAVHDLRGLSMIARIARTTDYLPISQPRWRWRVG
jgi:hypothetical protein